MKIEMDVLKKASQFEEKVMAAFVKTSIFEQMKQRASEGRSYVIGAAVSGGADSVSLLCSLNSICKKNLFPCPVELKVITVNHNMRPKEETEGDAIFVERLCDRLGVECIRKNADVGQVACVSKELRLGSEAAARKIRYSFFEEFIVEKNIDVLCLAHNQNDFYETMIMRFLQGSTKLSGIELQRGKFFRPLLEINREEIEAYLCQNSLEWKTDSTNLENAMLRNRIRNVLVPELNEEFDGWQKALTSLARKNCEDQEVIDSLVEKAMDECSLGASLKSGRGLDAQKLRGLHKAVLRRVLSNTGYSLGLSERLSGEFLEQVMALIKQRKDFSISSRGLCVSLRNDKLVLEKCVSKQKATESSFFVTIKDAGDYIVNGWNLEVQKSDCIQLKIKRDGMEHFVAVPALNFPFVFRSAQSADEVLCADGSRMSVFKVLSNFKAGQFRNELPVLQNVGDCEQEIVCIWASLCGLNNWIQLNQE